VPYSKVNPISSTNCQGIYNKTAAGNGIGVVAQSVCPLRIPFAMMRREMAANSIKKVVSSTVPATTGVAPPSEPSKASKGKDPNDGMKAQISPSY